MQCLRDRRSVCVRVVTRQRHRSVHFVAFEAAADGVSEGPMTGCVLLYLPEQRLHQMAVAVSAQGRGIGRLVVDALEAHVAAEGGGRVRVGRMGGGGGMHRGASRATPYRRWCLRHGITLWVSTHGVDIYRRAANTRWWAFLTSRWSSRSALRWARTSCGPRRAATWRRSWRSSTTRSARERALTLRRPITGVRAVDLCADVCVFVFVFVCVCLCVCLCVCVFVHASVG